MTTDKPFDPTKPVQARDGRPARIICMDANLFGGQNIVAIVNDCELYSYHTDGTWLTPGSKHPLDIINVAPPDLFDVLEALGAKFPYLKAYFARGTGGVDIDHFRKFLASVGLCESPSATKETSHD